MIINWLKQSNSLYNIVDLQHQINCTYISNKSVLVLHVYTVKPV